ncbi:ankyrin repeat domain-containing protein [Pokkaliibacter sp. CJK22405]|uniref:ankyrin repeat domain-containing protein n=1 Tax=Pokkaliibacter sp. CJK22405 TaxID=3384615 RepID=UPI003984BC07
MLQHRLGSVHIPATAYSSQDEQGSPSSPKSPSGAASIEGKLYYDPTGSLGQSEGAQQAGNAELVSPRDFAKSDTFPAFKQQYHSLVDRLGGYLLKHHDSASQWKQAELDKLKGKSPHSSVHLSTEQLLESASLAHNKLTLKGEQVPDWLSSLHTLHEFKQRLFEFQENGQNPHYPTDDELALAYGSLKHELEGLEGLLSSKSYQADRKVQSTLEVGIAAGKCAAGLEEETQQQKSTLRASVAGLPLKVANTRDHMALQHLQDIAAETTYAGDVRHMAAALYNAVKEEMDLGDLVGEAGNWSMGLERLGLDEDGIRYTLQRAKVQLNEALSATGVVNQVATEGFAALRDLVTQLPGMKDKADAFLDDMDMYTVTKELGNSKAFKQLSESFGEPAGLPVNLVFSKQPDDTYRLTSNPLKFELHLMQQMHRDHLGVDTDPEAVVSRTKKDADGNAINLTIAHWDDLVFASETLATGRSGGQSWAFDKADHELLSAHHLQHLSPNDLANKHLPPLGQRTSLFANPSLTVRDRALCMAILDQAVRNSDGESISQLATLWFEHAHNDILEATVSKLAELPTARQRLDSAHRVLDKLNQQQKDLVVESPAFEQLLEVSHASDYLDASQSDGIHPLLHDDYVSLDSDLVGRLMTQTSDFPKGAQGLRLYNTLLEKMDGSLPDEASTPADEVARHALSGYHPKDLLNIDQQLLNYVTLPLLMERAQAVPPKHREEWMLSMLQHLHEGESFNLDTVMDALLPQLPRERHEAVADQVLSTYEASTDIFAKVAVKHNLMGMLTTLLKKDITPTLDGAATAAAVQNAAVQYRSHYDQDSLLHLACESNNLGLIKQLMSTPLLNQANDYGVTPLNSAIQGRHTDAVKLLLSHPDINLAHKTERESTWEYWLNEGDRLYPRLNDAAFTPLGQAVLKGDTDEIVSALVARGADILGGWPSALHIATTRGNPETFRHLMTPETLADALPMLTNYTDTHSLNREAVINALVDLGAPMNKRDENNQPLTMTAFGSGDQAMLNVLMERGGPEVINQQDTYGFNLLMLAATHDVQPLVEALIQHGADTSATTDNGMRAIDMAQSDAVKDMLRGYPLTPEHDEG